jgi:hypothetical protein
MRFLDKLRDRLLPNYDIRARMRLAESGEKLQSFLETGAFDVLISEVLDPMEKEAFEAFKKLPPNDAISIIQTQKMAQIVDEIKRRVERKISAGLSAKQQIVNDSNPEEGE